MKPLKALVAPVGVISLPEYANENVLLLVGLKNGVVGNHALCGGYVTAIVQPNIKNAFNILRCSRCGTILASFSAKIQTYGAMRRHFQALAEKYLE